MINLDSEALRVFHQLSSTPTATATTTTGRVSSIPNDAHSNTSDVDITTGLYNSFERAGACIEPLDGVGASRLTTITDEDGLARAEARHSAVSSSISVDDLVEIPATPTVQLLHS